MPTLPTGLRSSRTLWLVLGAALLTGMLLATLLWALRTEVLHSGEDRTAALAQVIAEQTTRTLQSVDSRLQLTALRLDQLAARDGLQPHAAADVLREDLRDKPFVRAAWVLDAQGQLLFHSEAGVARGAAAPAMDPRSWQEGPAGLQVHLLPAGATGEAALLAVRPWRDEDGRLRGAIVAALQPGWFEATWRSIEVGRGGAIALLRRDGRMLARSPVLPGMLGRDFSQAPLFAQDVPFAQQGVRIRTSAVDGVQRVIAFRTLPAEPQLLVAVGTSLAALLAPWWRVAWMTAGVWAAGLGAALLLTIQVQRQKRGREHSEEQLLQQAGLLAMAGRLARLGGWRLEVASRRLTFTEQAAALLDLPADRAYALEELNPLFAPEALQLAQRQMQSCIQDGRPFDAEVEMVTPAGRRVWLRSIGQPVRDASGQVVAVEGAQQDVTARVAMLEEIRRLNVGLAEQVAQRSSALARQEALFRTLAEHAPLPIWMVEPERGTTFLSRAWYALVGGAPPQWQGHGWQQVVHPDDLPGVLRDWAEARRTGRAHAGTRRLRAADGSWHTTSFRAVPVYDAMGGLLFWVGIDTDITELVANQAALRLANEQLEAYAYSVSHDLQSPLQRVLAYLPLLEEALGEAAAPRARHYAARVRANAQSMAQLIDGLLALAQVSQLDLIRTRVDLSDMAADILRGLQAQEPGRRVRWRVEPGLAVLADGRLVRSVLENLVGNAWKFTGGKADAEIVVGGRAACGEYFVRDNGVGFDMAYADRLFGSFQRLHDADAFPGTGIGLATVARALSRMGGGIHAQARPGEGATFFFTLPPA